MNKPLYDIDDIVWWSVKVDESEFVIHSSKIKHITIDKHCIGYTTYSGHDLIEGETNIFRVCDNPIPVIE